MKRYKVLFVLCGMVLSMAACKSPTTPALSDAEVLRQNQDQLTKIIIYDVFTPPVASRLYVYSSLASYEAIRFTKSDVASIVERLRGFPKMPQPEKSPAPQSMGMKPPMIPPMVAPKNMILLLLILGLAPDVFEMP